MLPVSSATNIIGQKKNEKGFEQLVHHSLIIQRLIRLIKFPYAQLRFGIGNYD